MLEEADSPLASANEQLALITSEAVSRLGGAGGAAVTFAKEEGRAVITAFSVQGLTRGCHMARHARVGGEHFGVNVLELPAQERRYSNSLKLRRFRPLTGASKRLIQYHYPREGIGDEALRHLCDGRRVLGFVGVHRDVEQARYTLDDLDLIDASGCGWRRRILRSVASEEGFDGLTASLLLRDSGKLEHASYAASRWIDADRRSTAERVAREVASGRLPACDVVLGPSVKARFSRLQRQGDAKVLATLSPTHPVLVSPEVDLSPRQQRVAAYAASGANAFEIAEALKISAHTVRDHLKAVYRILGVRSRAQLATLLAEREDRPT